MAKTDLFLTHDWGVDEDGRKDHDRVAILNEAIKSLGYRTWFDGDRMVGDISKQMAAGIENTQAVVVFLTQRYLEKVNGDNPSDNCKLEFNHAARRRTSDRMICVVMERRMQNTSHWWGEVGMYLAGKIYINMSGDLNDKTYLQEQLLLLQKEVEGMGIFPNPNASKDDEVVIKLSEAVAKSSVSGPVKGTVKFRVRSDTTASGWAWDVVTIKVFDAARKKRLAVNNHFDSGCAYYDDPESYDCYHVRQAFSNNGDNWGGRRNEDEDMFYLGGEVERCEEYEVRMTQGDTHAVYPPDGECFVEVFNKNTWEVVKEIDIDAKTKAGKCFFKLAF